jgi:hypothetical protein
LDAKSASVRTGMLNHSDALRKSPGHWPQLAVKVSLQATFVVRGIPVASSCSSSFPANREGEVYFQSAQLGGN